MTQTQHDAAIKRLVDAGGTWPPVLTPTPPWQDSGRYESLPCRGCGQKCDPSRRWCPACGEVLP